MKKVIFAIVLLVSALGFFIPKAHAVNAVPDTSPVSTWAYSYAQVQYRIVGTGAYVNYFLLDATNETWPGTLEIEARVAGPNGIDTPWKLYGVTLGNNVNMSVAENRNMVAGVYCGQYDIYGVAVTQRCYSVL